MERISMGLFEEDGEKFYVLFDPKHGDMEFSSAEALRDYIASEAMTGFNGVFEWVTDDEPIELGGFEWVEPEDEDIFPRSKINLEACSVVWLNTSGTVPSWTNNIITTSSLF